MNASLVVCATDDFYIKIKHCNKHDNEEQDQETVLKRDCEILTDDECALLYKEMHYTLH